MTAVQERDRLMQMLHEARRCGARLASACAVIGIAVRTVQGWQARASLSLDGQRVLEPDRRTVTHNSPKHKLGEAQIAQVLAIANSAEFGDLPPSQIVPRLADQGRYVASESTIYRVLHRAGQLRHRRAERRVKTGQKHKLRAICATDSNQCYTWDITYLPTLILGRYYYWYVFVDLFSRRIVGHVVHDTESATHASALIQRIYLREGVKPDTLVVHSDNGSPMKGATMLRDRKSVV